MTTENSPNGHATAFERSIFFYCLECKGRAGRIEPAGWLFERRDQLSVNKDDEQKRIGKQPFHSHSRIETGLAEEAFQLGFPLVITIEARV